MQRGVGFLHAAVFQLAGTEVALFDFVLGQHQLLAKARLFQQQQGGAGAQVGLVEPLTALRGAEGQPVFDLGLLDRQVLAQYVEHRLIAFAERVEVIAQAHRLALVIQYAGIGQATGLQHFQQAIGRDVVQPGQLRVGAAAAQQLQAFDRAVVGQEVIVAVIAPVHFSGVLDGVVDFLAREFQGDGREAAQLGLGVFVDHLGQWQHKQS